MINKVSIFLLFLLFACQKKSSDYGSLHKEISVSSITGEMGCENCKMNLKKFIATSHALKLVNGDSHYYCSINCSTEALKTYEKDLQSVYAIDYGMTKYFPVEDIYYVVGSKLKGTMTKISKFAFHDLEKAISFKSTFSGKEVVKYSDVLKMSLEEINSR